MRKKVITNLLIGGLILGLCSSVSAGKGNNFPEGEHFNLNLIAKKSNPDEGGYFTCPPPESYQYDYYKGIDDQVCEDADVDGVLDTPENCVKCDFNSEPENCTAMIPSGQNVIFVPRDNDVDGDELPDMDISILIQSGADRPGKKNSISSQYPELTVTDWCTEHFPNDGDDEGSPAVFQLPENKNGYDVYARVTGKPVLGEAWKFMSPVIQPTQDEYGNDLIHFGTVGGPNGCTDAEGNVVLERVDTGKGNGKGNGVKQATDLSCLFEFAGDVCYLNDLCYWCPADDPCHLTTDVGPTFRCCTNQEGELDSCGQPANFDCVDPVWGCIETGFDPADTQQEICLVKGYVCTEDKLATDLMCYEYLAGTWAFDIADFVDVLWKSETSGAYVVQLRFYKK